MSDRPKWLRDERQRLVDSYGDEVVADIEASVPENPYGCKDSMDGRHWCRAHNSPWPSFSGQACEAALAKQDYPTLPTP